MCDAFHKYVSVAANTKYVIESANNGQTAMKNYIIFIIIIRHQSGLDRPVSAPSNSIFKCLPSRLRPVGL